MRCILTWLRLLIVFVLLYVMGSIIYSNKLMASPDNEPKSLPNPLSLQQALQLAGASYPDVVIANGMLEKATARRSLLEAENNVQINLELAPQTVKLTSNGKITGDSYASLSFSKKLYDFGYSHSLESARQAEIAQYKHQLTESHLQHQFEIIQAFYNVLLADLRYTYENEEMSQFYVKYDRLNERYSLGMVSEIEMLDAKNRYREQLNIRTASDRQRRISRQRLALKLNRPEQLPGELVMPSLSTTPLTIPGFDELYTMATKFNPKILALREHVKTKHSELSAQKAQFNPSLSAILDLNEYERVLRSRADVRLGLQLNVPIYLGGKKQAVNRLAYVEYLDSQQKLRQAEFLLREQLLELISHLETLKVEQQTALERVELKDLVLDKQRALYDMEIQASMGTSMANLTRAEWQSAQVEFDIVLTQYKISALLGKPFNTRQNEKEP